MQPLIEQSCLLAKFFVNKIQDAGMLKCTSITYVLIISIP